MSKKSRNRRKYSRQLNRILKNPVFLEKYWKMLGDYLCFGYVNTDDYNFVFN